MRVRSVGFLVVLAIAVGGCRGGTNPAAEASDVVASTVHGPVTFQEVEQVLRLQPASPDLSGGRDGIADVDAYLRAAEDIVVGRVLDIEAESSGSATPELARERLRLHRLAVAEVYVQNALEIDVRVSEEEARTFHDEHPELFHQPAVRRVWHLFRRHDDPRHPEATVELVSSLRDQVVAGASFEELAREYSHSETRALGGRLGAVTRGQLPPRLEEVVFELAEGVPSAPLVTADGVLLFLVTEAIDERQYPFEDVRLQVFRELQEAKLLEALEEAAAGQDPPPGSVVLADDELNRVALRGDDQIALEVDGVRWTVQELRDAFQESRLAQPPSLVPEQDLRRFYRRLVLSHLIALKAIGEGFETDNREAVEATERRLSSDRLRRVVVEGRLHALVEQSPDAVRQFFADNLFLYQTPLRLRLRSLEAPLGDDPSGRSAQLEALRTDLEAGRITLRQAAARVGGTVSELGWISAPELAALEPKVRHYLLGMVGRGYTVVFQLNRKLSLLEVVERDEPRPLSFEEAADAARRDYLDRSREQLYRQVVERILAAEEFDFHRERVERRLGGSATSL